MAHHRLASAVETRASGQLVPGDVSTLDRLGYGPQERVDQLAAEVGESRSALVTRLLELELDEDRTA